MKRFKTFIAEKDIHESPVQVVSRWLHKHNPKRLTHDADRATAIALVRKTPTSVKRALELKAKVASQGIDPNSHQKAEYYSSVARKLK